MPFSFIACNLSYCGHYGIGLEFQSYHSFHLSGEHEFGACYAITAEDSPSFILDWMGCLNNAHWDIFPYVTLAGMNKETTRLAAVRC